MSLALIATRAVDGLHAVEVTVEVHLANGLPAFNLVGLPETEVREARDRVRAAILTAQFEFPQKRITVNLAPADLPKEGGRFDLAIAIGILVASGQVDHADISRYEFCGELSLDGRLRPVRGILAAALAAGEAERQLILPVSNAGEAALARGVVVVPAPDLLAVCAHLNRHQLLPVYSVQPDQPVMPQSGIDLADVRGQIQARRALEIAAAGGHSILLFGPPGTGKSMLAQRLPGILPPMSEAEALEVAALQSLEGVFRPEQWGQRPFRSPHHSASPAALVGGGIIPRPGEISLAHRGVLFLDELPEFERRVLEALREPLETGRVSVSRARRRAEFPARFQLVAAMNPCPCGYAGHPSRACKCTPDQVERYRNRLSGPLLDRLDLVVEVPVVPNEELVNAAPGEQSAVVRKRVECAWVRQLERQGCSNSQLEDGRIESFCLPDQAGIQLIKQAMIRLGLSARGYHRILRVARTLADMADVEQVGASQVAEAIQYRRSLERPSAR